MSGVPVSDAEIGENQDWVQEVIIPVSGGGFTITPASGKLVIYYRDTDGTRYYWDGAAFIPTYTELATNIVGKESVYPFNIPDIGKPVLLEFEGWVNNDLTTMGRCLVRTVRKPSASLKF